MEPDCSLYRGGNFYQNLSPEAEFEKLCKEPLGTWLVRPSSVQGQWTFTRLHLVRQEQGIDYVQVLSTRIELVAEIESWAEAFGCLPQRYLGPYEEKARKKFHKVKSLASHLSNLNDDLLVERLEFEKKRIMKHEALLKAHSKRCPQDGRQLKHLCDVAWLLTLPIIAKFQKEAHLFPQSENSGQAASSKPRAALLLEQLRKIKNEWKQLASWFV